MPPERSPAASKTPSTTSTAKPPRIGRAPNSSVHARSGIQTDVIPPTSPLVTSSAPTTLGVPTSVARPPEQQKTFLDDVWDTRTARVLFTMLIIAAALAFCWKAHDTITLFLFAILFAYFLAPVVGLLQHRLGGRGRAIAVVYILFIGILVGIGFIAGPTLSDEARSLISSLPGLVDRIASGQIIAQLGRHYHWNGQREFQIQQLLQQHRADILNYAKDLAGHLASPIQHIWWLIIIPILSLFFLKQGEEIATEAIDLGRSRVERRTLRGLVGDINVMLGSYIRSQIILACLTLVAYSVVLSIMRVPYAIVLGPLGGFLEFIPVVGPAVGAVAITVIAILAGYPHAVILILFLGIWRLAQDYVNAPRIMGKSLEINPLLQIFSVLAGGEIAGVVGALVAVPIAATLRILWRRVGNPTAPPISHDQETTAIPSGSSVPLPSTP